MKVLQICVYLCFFFPASILADDLIGVVRSIDGKPLQGAFIYSRSQRQIIPREDKNPIPFQAMTDKDGRFRLTEYGRVLFIRKLGFKPLAKTLDTSDKSIEIFLEVDQPYKISLHCPPDKKSATLKLSGVSLRFDASQVTEIHHGVDSSYFLIKGKEKSDGSHLSILSGTTVSTGFPSEELILTSEGYQIHSLDVGGSMWISATGNLSNGGRWRFLGNSTMVISYKDVSNEDAVLFDKIIDSLCIEH